MINRIKMTTAASGALKALFNPASYDNVLILTDPYSMHIAQAFNEALSNFNSSIDCYVIPNEARPLKKIPLELEKLLSNKTIVLNIIKAYAEEIPFRIKWLFRIAENKKIRTAHMPGITEEIMQYSVYVDFDEMKKSAELILNYLDGAVKLRITTKEGTDLILGVKNRIFTSDIGVEEGGMCNLPCGEVYCAPLETKADGVVVFNASIGDIGPLSEPLKVFMKRGKITKIESNDKELVKKITKLSSVDAGGTRIGELGIGVNPGARLTGNILEDEKAIGTAHIAFGNNEDFPGGGKNKSKIHRDYLFYRPTIEVIYKDEKNRLIINDGVIVQQ